MGAMFTGLNKKYSAKVYYHQNPDIRKANGVLIV